MRTAAALAAQSVTAQQAQPGPTEMLCVPAKASAGAPLLPGEGLRPCNLLYHCHGVLPLLLCHASPQPVNSTLAAARGRGGASLTFRGSFVDDVTGHAPLESLLAFRDFLLTLMEFSSPSERYEIIASGLIQHVAGSEKIRQSDIREPSL